MTQQWRLPAAATVAVWALVLQGGAQAQAPKSSGERVTGSDSMTIRPGETIAGRVTEERMETTTITEEGTSCYREVDDFFNIREANSNVERGEWEAEQSFAWETRSDHSDDDIYLWTSLKYGITDDLFIELEVYPLNLGDGDNQGSGDLNLKAFWQVLDETECLPAFATWAEMRIPSGEGSSKVDGIFHFTLTKSWDCKFRTHFDGFVETANGGHGIEEFERRHFQWGLGPGFDYAFDDNTLGVLNYLMRSSDEYGRHNSNILEIGAVRKLAEPLHLKAALDVGLDGQDEAPNFGAKLQLAYDLGGCK